MKILSRRKVQICIETADKAVLLFPFPHILKLTSETPRPIFKIFRASNMKFNQQNKFKSKKSKKNLVFLSNMSLGFDLEPDEDAICFYFISTEIHPPRPRYVIFFDNEL